MHLASPPTRIIQLSSLCFSSELHTAATALQTSPSSSVAAALQSQSLTLLLLSPLQSFGGRRWLTLLSFLFWVRLAAFYTELAPNATETMSSCFDHISCLRRLKSFHSLIINPTLLRPPPPLAIIPYCLAKLTLSGFGYPWEHMREISELEYLRELKLQHYAFRGEKWDAKVIRFPELHRLTIEDTDLVEWTAEDQSFINLNYLTFKNCYKLREIPLFRWVIDIKLVDCNPLAETCAKQKHPGVSYFSRTEKVAANYSWK